MSKYDYLVVGAGLFGAIFAYEAAKKGKQVLVIDKRDHLAGNIYTKEIEGINMHVYGAHIFHTSNEEVWNYVNKFAKFNRYTNSPVAFYKDEVYNLPFNMNTFSKLWGVRTPKEAMAKIEQQTISLIGTDIYEKLIKGYTQKQWGKLCSDLPAFIIKRLPVRLTYDNNYFNDDYQGIPIGGYTQIVEKMLAEIEVKLNYDFFDHRQELESIADKIVFTGMIDEYYDYKFGELEYRSLRFETEVLDEENFQGNAVVNYTEYEVPYTRIIEHKHFEYGIQSKTIITKEYPADWHKGDEPYYAMNNDKNNSLYTKYKTLADNEGEVIFGGRLGMYKYFDMDDTIAAALECVKKELG